MQFPIPIARALIIYDNSGNAVITIGPGPHIIAQGTNGAIDIDASIPTPIIDFRNVDNTNDGRIELYDATSGNAGLEVTGGTFTRTGIPYRGKWLGDSQGGNSTIACVRMDTVQPVCGISVTEKTINMNTGDGTAGNGSTFFMTATTAQVTARNSSGTSLGFILCNSAGIRLGTDLTSQAVFYDNTNGFLLAGNSATEETWVGLSYQNGWSDLGSNWTTGAYRKMPDGDVQLRGVIIGGTKTDGTVIATLPASYRPPKDVILGPALISGGSTNPNYQIRIFSATGQIQCFGISTTSTGNMSLDGLRFSLLP